MRTGLLVALMMVVAAPATAQRGSVSAVTAKAAAPGAASAITIRGSNPCSAVLVDFGDGTSGIRTVKALPATVQYAYADPGRYRIQVSGSGTCSGSATTTVTIAGGAANNQGQAVDQTRFRGMDANKDGRITRDEWRGSAQSFRVHDWNGDGVLSGAEVAPGGRRRQAADDDYVPNRLPLDDWSERRFGQLDHNGDSRISRDEWHYDLETFRRADRNRDNAISRTEFLDTAFDDDRGDQFDDLDVNGNNRIEIAEWHGSRAAFDWLDSNRDGTISRVEMLSDDAGSDDQFQSLDINRDGVIALGEWHWSRASFNQIDRNRDTRLSRAEFNAAGPLGETGAVTKPLMVDSTNRWTDTGIFLRAGTTLTINATGTVTMSSESDVAGPEGSRDGRRAPNAPLPEEPAGMLLARIGPSEVLAVGDSRTIKVARDGRLYLGVNDDHLADNNGAFRVTIRTQVN